LPAARRIDPPNDDSLLSTRSPSAQCDYAAIHLAREVATIRDAYLTVPVPKMTGGSTMARKTPSL